MTDLEPVPKIFRDPVLEIFMDPVLQRPSPEIFRDPVLPSEGLCLIPYIEKESIPTVWTVSMIFVITGVLEYHEDE